MYAIFAIFLFHRNKLFDFYRTIQRDVADFRLLCYNVVFSCFKEFPVGDLICVNALRLAWLSAFKFIFIAVKYHRLLKFISLILLPILITNLIATSIFSGFDQETIRYAFAQQGQVPCTNGSLVPSPTECPSTDVCPSPSGPNTVAYCSLREPTKSSPTETNVDEQAEIAISTDKESYHPGEPVKIIMQNVGDQPFRVSGLNYNLTIVNLATNQSYPLVHGKSAILAVDSGGSANAIWNQLDDKGKQVSAGNYNVLAILDTLRLNTTFAISQQ